MAPNITIREIEKADYPLLEDFLYHAVFQPPGGPAIPREVIFRPEVFIYIKDFGGEHDCGVVAETEGQVIGMAWTRIIPAYGNIDQHTPELAISVLPEYRGQSVGALLMTRLFELLRGRGYRRTSLAVQQHNAAARFYTRLGYVTIRENDEEFIMVKDL
ncbi:MAG: GNAT family N-acetyltransferase [Oscillospiraceae bacterium]|nr:GNAT family N-acetyltransferase [Oscillospiraceae bacterium]